MISCIIPAYNEEQAIQCVIKNIRKISKVDEIIVVDDGSNDETFRKAKKMNVIILKHQKNKGKGAAIKTGFEQSRGDIILLIDADIIKIRLDSLKKLINSVDSGRADVSIGYYDSSYFQTFTEVVYKPLMKLLFPEVIEKISRGSLSGQRVFKKRVLEKLNLKDGFDLETGMNIELTFLQPKPKIEFVNLGKIKLKPKGYQKEMEIIPKSIIEYAKKYERFDRIEQSSFDKVIDSFYKTIKEVVNSEG